jgi:signal transduction histidine kinase
VTERPGKADVNTYTPSPMRTSALEGGRDTPPDAVSGEFREPASHAAERLRELIQSMATPESGAAVDEAMAQLPLALLEAQEQERSRLAEELHDGPAQALANAIFQTEILDRAIREDSPEANQVAQTELFSLRQILDRELEILRGYINQLRPSLDEAEGVDDALRDSAAAIHQRSGLPIDVSIETSAAELPEAARTVALRVAQEALRNIAKHSGASRAWVVTRAIDGPDGNRKWQLEVGDDGKGFDIDTVTSHPNRRHFGLRFMRERAELLGSELTITTNPSSGTIVRLNIETGG